MRETGHQAQHLAIWVIRSALRQDARPFRFRSDRQPDQWRDLAAPRALFRQSEAELAARRGYGLDVAGIGQLALTQDETHLLRAITAAQGEAPSALAAALAALGPFSPQTMASPVTILAAVLASHGYWLPEPAETPASAQAPALPLPGAALGALRHRTQSWRQAVILWP